VLRCIVLLLPLLPLLPHLPLPLMHSAPLALSLPQSAGVFAWRQVPRFIAAQWPQWFDIFNGSGSGYMRSADNINASPLLTRYPAKNLVEAIEASAANGTAFLPFGTLPVGYFVTDYLVPTNGSSSSTSNAQGYALKYPLENFLRCLNPKQ
jgi:hypothetical protein